LALELLIQLDPLVAKRVFFRAVQRSRVAAALVPRYRRVVVALAVVREKGPKRALHMIAQGKPLAAEFQARLDESAAPWWDPDLLWARAKQCTAGVFSPGGPGVPSASPGQAA